MNVANEVGMIPLTTVFSIKIALGLRFNCAFFLLLLFNAGIRWLAVYTLIVFICFTNLTQILSEIGFPVATFICYSIQISFISRFALLLTSDS